MNDLDIGPDRTRFSNSPLREMVVDIRVDQSSEMTFDSLVTNAASITALLPQMTRYENEAPAQANETRALRTAASSRGLLFSDLWNQLYLQVSLEGFALSVLQPYPGWEYAITLVRQLFDQYRAVANPLRAVRLGVRYINHLDFTSDRIAFSDVLNFYPHWSADLGNTSLSRLYMQGEFPQIEHPGTLLVVTIASLAAPTGHIALELDLDVSRKGLWPVTAPDEIFAAVESLHGLAYSTFSQIVTDQYKGVIS
jgi:uncharacterized protein (TIGR04255 family)